MHHFVSVHRASKGFNSFEPSGNNGIPTKVVTMLFLRMSDIQVGFNG